MKEAERSVPSEVVPATLALDDAYLQRTTAIAALGGEDRDDGIGIKRTLEWDVYAWVGSVGSWSSTTCGGGAASRIPDLGDYVPMYLTLYLDRYEC